MVERQLKYLQQRRDIAKAYECFDWFGQIELDRWEAFGKELSSDPDFKPLVEHINATVMMVVQQPDPNYCRCLVRLIMPNYDDSKIQLSKESYVIPLYYWWGMRLEELVETEEYGTLAKGNPGEAAVWKVEGIVAGVDTPMDIDDEEFYLDEDGNIVEEEDIF